MNKNELAKRFAKVVQEMDTRENDIEELLNWTYGTLRKGYDAEEEFEALEEDTLNWLNGEAPYMKN